MLIYYKILEEIKRKRNGEYTYAQQMARDALDEFEKAAVEGIRKKRGLN